MASRKAFLKTGLTVCFALCPSFFLLLPLVTNMMPEMKVSFNVENDSHMKTLLSYHPSSGSLPPDILLLEANISFPCLSLSYLGFQLLAGNTFITDKSNTSGKIDCPLTLVISFSRDCKGRKKKMFYQIVLGKPEKLYVMGNVNFASLSLLPKST